MDVLDIARMFFALLAVLALIGLAALAARKAGLVANGGVLARKRRLQLVETLALDARRRAAIIRCDGREHLVLLGAHSETVVAADLPAPAADHGAALAGAAPRPTSPQPRRSAISAEAA
jgi:flagellar protein FliO/FliZ